MAETCCAGGDELMILACSGGDNMCDRTQFASEPKPE
jgi:hypothetical protein